MGPRKGHSISPHPSRAIHSPLSNMACEIHIPADIAEGGSRDKYIPKQARLNTSIAKVIQARPIDLRCFSSTMMTGNKV